MIGIIAGFKNWKTTILGVLALITAVGAFAGTVEQIFEGNIPEAWALAQQNYEGLIAALVGLGLINARDADKSSEESGLGW